MGRVFTRFLCFFILLGVFLIIPIVLFASDIVFTVLLIFFIPPNNTLFSVFLVVAIVFLTILIIIVVVYITTVWCQFCFGTTDFRKKLKLKPSWNQNVCRKFLKDIKEGAYPIHCKLDIRCYHSGYTEYGGRYEVVTFQDKSAITDITVESITLSQQPELKEDELITLRLGVKFESTEQVNVEIDRQLSEIKRKYQEKDKYCSVSRSNWALSGLPKVTRFNTNGEISGKLQLYTKNNFFYYLSIFCCFFPLDALIERLFRVIDVQVIVKLKTVQTKDLKFIDGERMKLSDVVKKMPFGGPNDDKVEIQIEEVLVCSNCKKKIKIENKICEGCKWKICSKCKKANKSDFMICEQCGNTLL